MILNVHVPQILINLISQRLKIGVLETLFGCPSQLGIQVQTSGQQVSHFSGHLWKHGFEGFSLLDFGQSDMWKQGVCDEGQLLLRSEARTEQIHNELEGVEVGFAWKEGHTVVDLSENAAQRPDVHTCIICCIAYKEFRASIPSSWDVIGINCSRLQGELAGEPKVAQLEHASVGEKKILGLNISMNYILRMHEGADFEELVHDEFHLIRGQSIGIWINILEHSSLYKLKY